MKLASLLQCGCGAMWPEDTAPSVAVSPLRNFTAAPRNCRRAKLRFKRWTPSLSAISEQGSTAAEVAGIDTKAKASVSRRDLPHSHSEDNRYMDVSSVVSAICPTAYLF
ncbi:uncharacterized protein LOC141842445 [Curcuma longa]|uniref:uncharacterized protein LOC141842445 n=1 Tax=Curcuma longa TaxID=136217 RepID=UPI003D9EBBC7